MMETTSEPERVQSAVEVRDLVKAYMRPGGGSLRAVDGISFAVRAGEFFGILGPNGAGKTTTLEIIEGIRQPTSGEVRVLGVDPRRELDRLKRMIGVQLQATSYFSLLTIEELLELFGSFYPKRRSPTELLTAVGLAEQRKAYVRQLSGGQQHRFSVAAALVNDPDVLFLDEPTTGLDPQMRHSLWDLLRQLNHEGKTIVLTTHYIEEAERLADRVAIMDHGRIVALDTPGALIERHARGSRVRFGVVGGIPPELGICPSSGHSSEEYRVGPPGGAPSDGIVEYEVPEPEPTRFVAQLAKVLGRGGVELRTIQIKAGSLEDVFLTLTGRELRD